jgi:hypothetical protein
MAGAEDCRESRKKGIRARIILQEKIRAFLI